jgi:hypothetical protein
MTRRHAWEAGSTTTTTSVPPPIYEVADLSRPTYRDVILTPTNNVQLFSTARNVTDIVYGDNLVDVNGPRYEQVASQAKIPSYKLSYVTENQGRFGINPTGNQLQVMAPPPQLQQSGTVQPKIEKTLGQAEVERGWQEIDPQKAAQFKQTMQRQAPVPAELPPKPTPPRPAMAKARSGAQQASPVPQEQPPRTEPSPIRAAGEQNVQTKKPAQQEANAPREEERQFAAP